MTQCSAAQHEYKVMQLGWRDACFCGRCELVTSRCDAAAAVGGFNKVYMAMAKPGDGAVTVTVIAWLCHYS